jgi:triacylglycerol lipase
VHIVLVHGVLGFGRLPSLVGIPVVRYFNGVATHLGARHRVVEPSLNPIGSVVERGDQLARAIERLPLGPGEKVHVIAHSMGGLDARHAIGKVGDRVAGLATIGTPHRGSPVADAIAHRKGPLAGRLPTWLEDAFSRTALIDLTTEVATAAMAATADAPGVRYVDVAGDASRGSTTLALFHVAAAIGGITGEVNDGVVTRRSALVAGHRHLPDWPVDHAGEIGWGYEFPLPAAWPFAGLWPPARAHFARYDAIVQALVGA